MFVFVVQLVAVTCHFCFILALGITVSRLQTLGHSGGPALRWVPVKVVKQSVIGTVVGQSATDPAGRVTVAFSRREDGRSNNLPLGSCSFNRHVISEVQPLPK